MVGRIRTFRSADVENVIQVHMNAFQGFFLTFLGPAFLRELYIGISEDPFGVGFVYENSSISGFVVGTLQSSGFYRRLIRKRLLKFGIASLKPVISKPLILPRLFRALTLTSQIQDSQSRTATLMSLAVLQNFQKKGIGKQLVMSFLESCRERKVVSVNLTTDALDNDKTNEFYLKMGFACARTFTTPEGRLMNEYVFNL